MKEPTFNRQRIDEEIATLWIQINALYGKAKSEDRTLTAQEREQVGYWRDAQIRLARRYTCIQLNPALESK